MELNFLKPATYRICVKGRVPENWSDRLGGMTITEDQEAEYPVAILHGQLGQGDLTGC